MTDLRTLIKETKVAKRELVATTVRMPKEMQSFVEELTEYLGLSKQEILLKLIEAGANIAKDELKLDSLEDQEQQEGSTFHILNTNKRNSIDDHESMLKDGIAAAYYDPWKFNIDRINQGDTVFLYANGVGIVAYGKGTGNTLRKDHNGNKDECHYQELLDYKVLKKPLPASEVKRILNRNVVFLRTMSGAPDGYKILERIEK